jgi:hypothetical protein
MKRYALALGLTLVLASLCWAQPPQIPSTPTPTSSGVTFPPPYGPYRQGGLLSNGCLYFGFDSGDYLLGGFDGMIRHTGYFYMGYPQGPASAWNYNMSECAGRGCVRSAKAHGYLTQPR